MDDSELGSRCSVQPIMDFVAVISTLRLTELHDEPELAIPTPRDTYLRVSNGHLSACGILTCGMQLADKLALQLRVVRHG